MRQLKITKQITNRTPTVEKYFSEVERQPLITQEQEIELARRIKAGDKEAEDILNLKVSEREEQIASMQRQILVLKRKSEQGSQQLQGEVLELELEEMLRSKFPFDTIEPVAKGEFGGDVVQRVISPTGLTCGAILCNSSTDIA